MKEKSLSSEIMKHEHYGDERVLLAKDVKETMLRILDRVDRLQVDCATLEVCKKEEVENIIKEEAGEELIKRSFEEIEYEAITGGEE